jgi:hypothetical protein
MFELWVKLISNKELLFELNVSVCKISKVGWNYFTKVIILLNYIYNHAKYIYFTYCILKVQKLDHFDFMNHHVLRSNFINTLSQS